jgi:ElaB/YqjD/DUF883 family membrane-anchored ribosome-binding protein
METRNPGEQGRSGMGEVHSHLSQPDKGVGMSGSQTGGAAGGYGGSDARDRAGEMASDARDRAGSVVEDARENAEEALHTARDKANELKHRAEDTVDHARARASDALHRAEQELEERTGAISMIRDNPLPAIGIAVAVGYLAAGSRSRKRGRVMNLATRQLRAAIMGGISAALAREFRSIVSEQGGSLASIFGEEQEGSKQRKRSGSTTRDTGFDAAY